MLHFECPSCRRQCETTPEFAGKLVVCPHCAQSVTVPRDEAAITTDPALPPTAPRPEADVEEERWRHGSIQKDGGAAGVWLRNSVLGVIAVGVGACVIALVINSTRRVNISSPRTQSINNLKNIGLAMHSFHDGNKRLPFNGSDNPAANDPNVKYCSEAKPESFRSGSWAFQISPFIDHGPMFANPAAAKEVSVWCLHCPERGRPLIEKNGGAWSDYFFNNYLNDPLQAANPSAADQRRTLVSITDGTSNTILVGQGNIDTRQYSFEANVVRCTNIFTGGTGGTMRSGDSGVANPTGVTLQRDSAAGPRVGSWGGPYPQGALMCMGDATVRMFPYSMEGFSAFLTPTGGENVVLPDT